MGPQIRRLLGVILIAWFAAQSASAEPGTVEVIEVQGLNRMTREAFLHAFAVRVGDPYDEAILRIRLKALWKQGLFEDVSIESEDAPGGGKAVIVKIRERPVLSAVTYEDTKVATRTQIEDELKKRGYVLRIGKPIDMRTVFFAQSTIRDLVAQGGYLDATVKAAVQEVTATTRAVHFEITAGRKTRIRKITFEGNEIFSSRKLKQALELTQQRKWYYPWSQKNLYHPLKWDQDVANLRELYTNLGYLDVAIRPPVVEVHESKKSKKAAKGKKGKQAPPDEQTNMDADDVDDTVPPEPAADPAEADDPSDENLTAKQLKKRAKRKLEQEKKAKKKAKKAKEKAAGKGWVELIVSIDENEQYTLGEVTITGNEKFSDKLLHQVIRLKPGSVLRNNVLEQGVNDITRLYENQGHLYATVVRQIHRRDASTPAAAAAADDDADADDSTAEPTEQDGNNVADVEVVIEEDRPYYVARIEFNGNSATHDRVLRREMLSSEGDLFSRDRVDFSRLKVNQLGYWQTQSDVLIEPVEGEDQVNVTLAGQEQGRNEIQVGGGYSGFDGAFFNGVYSTRNFLGRGQVLSTSMQIGGRSSRYQISFQEPWFLSRPILFGLSVRKQSTDFGRTLQTDSDGFGIILGRRLGRFSQLNVGYNFDRVDSRTQLIPTVGTTFSDLNLVRNQNEISSLTPVYSYSSINNPYRPSRGKALNFSVQMAGGVLGGDTAFVKPVMRFTGYKRAGGLRYFAFHAQVGLVSEWADGSDPNSSNINGVPTFQRFWLGGDSLGPRVFETRTITPRLYIVQDENNRVTNVLFDPRFLSAGDVVDATFEVGGDRFFLIQNEFVMPINEQAEFAMFLDIGDSLFEDQPFDFRTTRVSAGVEMRFHLPIFPVPLRLIYGLPVRKIVGPGDLPGDRTSSFQFSIGRSF